MFLVKNPENRHLSKFQPKIILSLDKPYVSDKAPEISPIAHISAQNHFEFGKPHVSDKAPGKSPEYGSVYG